MDLRLQDYETLRKYTNLSHAEIGRKIGVSTSTVKNYEKALRMKDSLTQEINITEEPTTQSIPSQHKPSSPDNTIFYVGGGIGLLVILGLIIYIIYMNQTDISPEPKSDKLKTDEQKVKDYIETETKERVEEARNICMSEKREQETKFKQEAEEWQQKYIAIEKEMEEMRRVCVIPNKPEPEPAQPV